MPGTQRLEVIGEASVDGGFRSGGDIGYHAHRPSGSIPIDRREFLGNRRMDADGRVELALGRAAIECCPERPRQIDSRSANA